MLVLRLVLIVVIVILDRLRRLCSLKARRGMWKSAEHVVATSYV